MEVETGKGHYQKVTLGDSEMKRGLDSANVLAMLCLSGLVNHAMSAPVTVNLATKHQKISGFGASTAWGSGMSTTDADLLWSTTKGAGLSLHRIRIDTNFSTSEMNIAKMAVARGATVWATPWTPPSSMKINEKKPTVMGLLAKHQAYADKLLGFTKTMKNNGVPIYAVSAQNEPDANVDYESCKINPDSMALWVGKYMGPTFAGSGVKVMSPESQNWWGIATYWAKLKTDPDFMKYADIIATHEYGGTVKAYPEIQQAGKEFWQTEIYDTEMPADPGIGSGLRVAKLIHEALTIANMNAWHFWWVYPVTTDNGALWDKTTNKATKRLWVMGNFSRFVRPGDIRVEATLAPTTGVTITAYRDESTSKLVIVAINTNGSATNQDFSIAGATPTKMIPYVTDATQDLAAKSEQILTSNAFTYSLPAKSVTTLVIQLGNTSLSSAETSSSSSAARGPYNTVIAIPGSIQMENYDVGGEGVTYHDEDTENSGNAYRADGVDIVGDATTGYKVGWTVAGEWMEYSVAIANAGKYKWEAKVSSGGDGAAFHMSIDGIAISENVIIPNTTDWDTYTTVVGTTTSVLPAGNHILRVTIDGSYGNMDMISFMPNDISGSIFSSKLRRGLVRYQVYDLHGQWLGEVKTMDENGLLCALEKKIHRTGVYILKSESSNGIISRKISLKVR